LAPITGATEYPTPNCDLQTLTGPLIAFGAAGFEEANKQRALLDPQGPEAITQTLPVEKVLLILTEMVVPVLDVMLIPEGTVQLYDVAPDTAAMEYEAVVVPAAGHKLFAGPETAPGCIGLLYSVKLRGLLPHELTAATVNTPPVQDAFVLIVHAGPELESTVASPIMDHV